MKAFVLAAGLGKRLRPLTLKQPKPLIQVAGCSLIGHHLHKLRRAGVDLVVINTHWLADQMRAEVGDGSAFGLQVVWSHEAEILETGGGIYRAREALGEAPFLLVSADVYSDFDYAQLVARSAQVETAHLVMVPNPGHKVTGDFKLQAGRLSRKPAAEAGCTYSGIGVIRGAWVQGWNPDRDVFPLVEPLHDAADAGQLAGQLYRGFWTDVGTPERLAQLRSQLDSPCS